MWFYQWFWTKNFFMWLLVIWFVFAFFYLVFRPFDRLKMKDSLKEKDLEAVRVDEGDNKNRV